jgi:hypothetical protein
MNETAQVVLASGVVVFLLLIAVAVLIWVRRCAPDSVTYRNPLLILSAPTVLGAMYLVDRLTK